MIITFRLSPPHIQAPKDATVKIYARSKLTGALYQVETGYRVNGLILLRPIPNQNYKCFTRTPAQIKEAFSLTAYATEETK